MRTKFKKNEKWFCKSGLEHLGELSIYDRCIEHIRQYEKNEDVELNGSTNETNYVFLHIYTCRFHLEIQKKKLYELGVGASIGAKQARQNNQMPVLVFAGGFGVALSTAVHTIELSPSLY